MFKRLIKMRTKKKMSWMYQLRQLQKIMECPNCFFEGWSSLEELPWKELNDEEKVFATYLKGWWKKEEFMRMGTLESLRESLEFLDYPAKFHYAEGTEITNPDYVFGRTHARLLLALEVEMPDRSKLLRKANKIANISFSIFPEVKKIRWIKKELDFIKSKSDQAFDARFYKREERSVPDYIIRAQRKYRA